MKRHIYIYRIETRKGPAQPWVVHSRWNMVPRLLAEFLRDFCRLYQIHPNKVRAKRDKPDAVIDAFYLPGGKMVQAQSR